MARRKTTRPAGAPPTPEHDKLREVVEFSQKIGEFLDWLQHEKHYEIARRGTIQELDLLATMCEVFGVSRHGRMAERAEENPKLREVDALVPIREKTEELLAEFFGIDRWKLEDEKRALLDYCRAQHDAAQPAGG
jgi:hypothetical protein